MGSQQDEGLLLQPVLVPSDASKEKEQDEGSGGCDKKDAHRRLASENLKIKYCCPVNVS